MEAEIIYSEDEVKDLVLAHHLTNFKTPEGYRWRVEGTYSNRMKAMLSELLEQEEETK